MRSFLGGKSGAFVSCGGTTQVIAEKNADFEDKEDEEDFLPLDIFVVLKSS